ncbi:hypothetical protein B0H63DRAFT_530420 [Podospora didyma]|uniref:Carrier domain-containing protein n=1 Tax=Podospora didyma TaxID=330526 RepID=A0AAE0P457_9PEZI|nr:hypothetical protein B0H63DRAFT_530420 [Podospora didyma]
MNEDEKQNKVAILMLTSGSTGNAKAVCLTHKQVLAAVAGKAGHRKLPEGRPLLNWIGLDHVASLIEIHMLALWLGVDQVHVTAADVVSNPMTFLELLGRHKVARSFAPNFFLAKLVSKAANSTESGHGQWDLSSLVFLASGGEANDMNTCVAAAAVLEKHGAPANAIAPGFGMTETCAGCIHNLDCPAYDIAGNDDSNTAAVTSLGKGFRGVEMRIVTTGGHLAKQGEPGHLQVRGPVVSVGYYNNLEATDASFTPDGWFRTGDQGAIDGQGSLRLMGRTKDVVNINGVKLVTDDIKTVLEQAILHGYGVAWLMVFPSKAAHTEQVTIAYMPKDEDNYTDLEMAVIDELLAQATMSATGSRPFVFAIRSQSRPLVLATALGKISRAKMRTLFEASAFENDVKAFGGALARAKTIITTESPAASEDEKSITAEFADELLVSGDHFGINTSVFDLGFTSMHLIRLKNRIDARFNMSVPISTLIRHPTAKSLAKALFGSQTSTKSDVGYDPVVTFRASGSETPLWLIHPGVGEVLVFVGLAHHLSDNNRPILALRARGFEEGQSVFSSIAEAVDLYIAAIRKRQPNGPYALCGYSYGTMLAFEVAKRLRADFGEEVPFLGNFNLPPHIKARMRRLSWNMCLLNLAYFLGLTTEEYAETVDEATYRDYNRERALAEVLCVADVDRLQELGLGLLRWTDVAYGLQSMAVDYEPTGLVDSIDIFYAIPLRWAAKSRAEWVSDHLSRWADFSRSPPRFHDVAGAHYTMLGPDHVVGFSQTLKASLRARGI